jgi:malonyl-CoA O-methyltransferase
MKISTEFSKYASQYSLNNVIQDKVASKLLSCVTTKPKKILDLGCGSGAICKKIDWEYKHFVGVDFAPGMLELHPKSKKIESINGDFNDDKLFENLLTYQFDYIISASALQWSIDLKKTFEHIKSLDSSIALAIFTSNTFKSMNETASIQSILKSAEEVYKLQKQLFNAEFEIVNYQLEFESTRDMFRYIKQSGVSGSRKVLDYKQTKKLMNEYPLNYLEFEVVFIYSV